MYYGCSTVVGNYPALAVMIKMIKLIKSNPPIFEFELLRESQLVVIKLKALYWFQYDESARQDILQTSVERFATYKNLAQWIACFDYLLLNET